jgi:hypothetical protein
VAATAARLAAHGALTAVRPLAMNCVAAALGEVDSTTVRVKQAVEEASLPVLESLAASLVARRRAPSTQQPPSPAASSPAPLPSLALPSMGLARAPTPLSDSLRAMLLAHGRLAAAGSGENPELKPLLSLKKPH